MDSNTATVIQTLADKLGTTSEYVWAVLIRQAPISAAITAVEVVVVAICVYLFVRSLPWAKRLLQSDEHDITGIVYLVSCGITLFLLVLVSLLSIESAITGLLNPEYWALDKVLSAIKRK